MNKIVCWFFIILMPIVIISDMNVFFINKSLEIKILSIIGIILCIASFILNIKTIRNLRQHNEI